MGESEASAAFLRRFICRLTNEHGKGCLLRLEVVTISSYIDMILIMDMQVLVSLNTHVSALV